MIKGSIGTVFLCFVATASAGVLLKNRQLNDAEIHGYHFHTYFFQNNANSTSEALKLRSAIQDQINSGYLANCRLNKVNTGPIGPHPGGSFETCCNKTSISQALSFFMQNYGDLSILLHPLTTSEYTDHTSRSMFLGPRWNLDVAGLADDLSDRIDLCLPL